MPVPVKLGGFAVILLAVFGAAFGIGRAVGPVGDEPSPPAVTTTTHATTPTTAGHGGHS